MLMRILKDKSGKRKIVFLSQVDKDYLIYMNSDVWITPELKRFKRDLLRRAREKSIEKNSENWN